MGRPPVIPAEQKTRIVLSVLAGEVSIAEAARKEKVSEQSIGPAEPSLAHQRAREIAHELARHQNDDKKAGECNHQTQRRRVEVATKIGCELAGKVYADPEGSNPHYDGEHLADEPPYQANRRRDRDNAYEDVI